MPRTDRIATVIAVVSAPILFATTAPTPAQEPERKPADSLDRTLLQFNAGQVGLNDSIDDPWRYELQYRFRPLTRYRIVPSLSAAYADNDNNFIAAELRRDFRLHGPLLLTPSFGVGRFNNQIDLDLGKPLEFRSGLELSYQFANGYRVGAAIFHLSNGGLSDDNPGTESGVITFTMPLD